MRAFLAAACILVLLASATPVSADIDLRMPPPPHYPSMVTEGAATSTFYGKAFAATFTVRDDRATLTINGVADTFTVAWTKHETVEGNHDLFSVHITGTSTRGALDLQGAWQPTVGIGVCTMSLPGHCTVDAEGPIALTGHVGAYTLDVAGVAYDTYGYSTGGPICAYCEANQVITWVERALDSPR